MLARVGTDLPRIFSYLSEIERTLRAKESQEGRLAPGLAWARVWLRRGEGAGIPKPRRDYVERIPHAVMHLTELTCSADHPAASSTGATRGA